MFSARGAGVRCTPLSRMELVEDCSARFASIHKMQNYNQKTTRCTTLIRCRCRTSTRGSRSISKKSQALVSSRKFDHIFKVQSYPTRPLDYSRLSTPPLSARSPPPLSRSLSLASAKIPPLRLRLLCLSSFNSCKRLHKTISGFHPGSHSPSPAREPHTTPPSRPCPC